MIRRTISVLLLSSILSYSPVMADWEVGYGNEKGKAAVFNSKTSRTFTEDSPYGPMSFRIVKDNLWLLDSIGSRIYCFDEKNKLKNEIMISGLQKNTLLEDFALNYGSNGNVESFWVADAADCLIRKVSSANGSELLKIGGNGNETGKFLQINQLETDKSGRLYVGDCGRRLICVFTRYGEPVREIPWENNGFCIDADGRLHLLVFKESAGYFYRIYSQQGRLESSRHIGLQDLMNSRLWALSPEGNLIITFIPAGGFKGFLKLMEVSSSGRIVKRTEIAPPGSMNRFIDFSDSRFWIAEADFFAAPDGFFKIKSSTWEEKK